MKNLQKILLVLIILFVCISCDQLTKNIAVRELSTGPSITYLGDSIVLQFTRNKGAFLSMGSNWPDILQLIFLKLLPVIFLFIFSILLFRAKKADLLFVTAVSLILGGGLSNLRDRIFNDGYVVDFMNIGIGSLRTGIFNFADIFITAGSVLMLIAVIRQKRSAKLQS